MENLKQELAHLESIKEKLGKALSKEKASLENQKGALLSSRKDMWDNAAHGVNDFDDIVSMATHDELVREQFGHYVRKDATVRQLEYLLKTPYFGRIDFQEYGLNLAEQVYIGRYGFCDKKTYEFDIYDWRAPIANMFYECFPGRASYQCPAGEIKGELTCKRQYMIRDGKLEYFYDTNMAVQDELLGKVLSENTDKVLRVIIDTITREQNHAIRQPGAMDILITGPAGSGKTSVGMHRLAYLLYNNRDSLSSDKIVIMSRNQIFSSYLSGILPELGEENVRDVLFDELINKGIPKEYQKHDYYEQVEFLLKNQEETVRKKAIRLKYSEAFLNYLENSLKKIKVFYLDAEWFLPLYLQVLKKFDASAKDVYEYTKACLDEHKLYYEDLLIWGYIRILKREIRPMEQISHVVLDEAQDYNRLQLRILKKIYPKSRFTILADANQAVYPEISTVDPTVFGQIFGCGLQEITLRKSYRSTAPINAFAFDILGIRDTDLYIDRPGKTPQQLAVKDMAEGVLRIISETEKEKSIAILTCDNHSAFEVKRSLGAYADISGEEPDRKIEYILKPDMELTEKITVIPVMLAKGLEFDTVIIWDDRTEDYWKVNKHLKYLMCTRALHELYIVSL